MKTRNGFISNSSSTSFIVFGKTISTFDDNIDQVEEWIKKNYDVRLDCGDWGEGNNFIRITEKSLPIIKQVIAYNNTLRQKRRDDWSYYASHSIRIGEFYIGLYIVDGGENNPLSRDDREKIAKFITDDVVDGLFPVEISYHCQDEVDLIEDLKEKLADHGVI